MLETSQNFKDRLRQVKKELEKEPPEVLEAASASVPAVEAEHTNDTASSEVVAPEEPEESSEQLRGKILRYRELQKEEKQSLQDAQEVAIHLQEAEQLIAQKTAPGESVEERTGALQNLDTLVQEMRQALDQLAQDRQTREMLMRELFTPSLERFLEQAAEAEAAVRENIEELKALLQKEGESLHKVHRLELQGRLYGLEPSAENRRVLEDGVHAIVPDHAYYGNTGSENAAEQAISQAIEFSAEPLDVRDLIELIQPSKEYLDKQAKGHRETIESLYSYARDRAYKHLAEKTIQRHIDLGRPEDAKKALAQAREELSQRRNALHTLEIGKFQKSILDLYLKTGNIDGARAFVESPDFSGGQNYSGDHAVEAWVAIFKTSGDVAELERARSTKTYDTLYNETRKWQKIGEISGDDADMQKANRALKEMSNNSSYTTHSLFTFYEQVHDLKGIDSVALEQVLREKAKSMHELDRAKAYFIIAGMSGRAEDEDTLRKELEAILTHGRDYEKGMESKLFTNQEYILDAASAYGYLLNDFLWYVEKDMRRVTPQNRQIAERLLNGFEGNYRFIKKEHSRARTMFWSDATGAKERIATVFETPEQFRSRLASDDKDTLWRKARVRMNYYGGNYVAADQQAIRDIFDALEKRIPDATELSSYMSDLTWRLPLSNEQDSRFVMDLIDSHTRPDVKPVYDYVRDALHRQLAEYTAHTSDADRHIAEIDDNRQKALTLTEVVKKRRELSRIS